MAGCKYAMAIVDENGKLFTWCEYSKNIFYFLEILCHFQILVEIYTRK